MIDKRFPRHLSPTAINQLINDFDGFYIERILRVKKLDQVNENFGNKQFGSLVHEILNQYSIQRNLDNKIDLESILNRSCINLPKYIRAVYEKKLRKIIHAFINFDNERRKSSPKIYTEVPIEYKEVIDNNTFTISAIADRIDVFPNGVEIIDYKTGALPSVSSVKNGTTIQLLIEAIILYNNCTDFLPKKYPTKLMYVKLSSAEPYIETTEVKLSPEELEHHRFFMINKIRKFAFLDYCNYKFSNTYC